MRIEKRNCSQVHRELVTIIDDAAPSSIPFRLACRGVLSYPPDGLATRATYPDSRCSSGLVVGNSEWWLRHRLGGFLGGDERIVGLVKRLSQVLSALAWAAVVACVHLPSTAPRSGIGAWGVDLTGIDRSVRPGDDFFDFANGAWYARTGIPADRAEAGSFETLRELRDARLLQIVADLRSRNPESLTSEQRKVVDLFAALIDTAAIEAGGLGAARRDLDRIATADSLSQIASLMGDPALQLGGPFSSQLTLNPANPREYVVQLYESGLDLPSRVYYFSHSSDIATVRAAYREHLAALMGLIGLRDPSERADEVLALEKAMAHAQVSADTDTTNNRLTIAQLTQVAPGFPWRPFFAAQGILSAGPHGTRLISIPPYTALSALAALFARTLVAVWRDYLTVRYLHRVAALLPVGFDRADFAFYGTVLGGASQPLPRGTRAVRLIDSLMPDALDKLYVREYCPSEITTRVSALAATVVKAYEADIRTLDWMTDTTQQAAIAKVQDLVVLVGYPARWRDYSALAISRNDPIGDVERSRLLDWKDRLARLDRPARRDEWWSMTASTVNAVYLAGSNAIVLPAATLNAPLFDPKADDAVNYGGIGVIIAHEITHAFNDQGVGYTGADTLVNRWSDVDRLKYDARTEALREQFGTFELLPGARAPPWFANDEIIADLSGLAIALRAYHLSLEGRPAPVLDGYTGDQRYFLAFAQARREKYREEHLRRTVQYDPHGPARLRVIGPTRNVEAWYTAFNIQPDAKYYLPPDKRVRIW
jgi:putative endopeptidase